MTNKELKVFDLRTEMQKDLIRTNCPQICKFQVIKLNPTFLLCLSLLLVEILIRPLRK